jgi:type IV fimbrial biogenesis protein FimT
MVFVDVNNVGRRAGNEQLLRTYTPDARRVTIKSSPGRARVVFQPSGLSPGTNVTFTVCAGANPARYIVLSNTGRVRVSALPGSDGIVDKIHEICP